MLVEMAHGIWSEVIHLLNRMSPYLLFGFFFAGVLHVIVSMDTFASHLGKRGFLSIIKAVVFGLLVALIGCHQGYHAKGGARGVGLATMRTVVMSSVSILIVDFIVTDILIVLGF